MKKIIRLKTVKSLGNIFILLGSFLLIIALMSSEAELIQIIFSIIGMVLSVLGLILFLILWKCPYCHTHLPFVGRFGIKNCPYCGNDLEL